VVERGSGRGMRRRRGALKRSRKSSAAQAVAPLRTPVFRWLGPCVLA